MGVSIRKTGHGPAALGHVGTVEDVIAAHLAKEMTSRRYKASDFTMGFELATPKSLSSMGEALLVNGFCFANSTDSSSPEYNKTISGDEFISGGVFLVPKEAKPSHEFEIKEKLSMIELYNQIYREIDRPLVFSGIFHFSDFHGTAIGKPPINGHEIFSHKKEYYPNPDVHAKNVWGFVMGAITNFQGYAKINEDMKTVLYKNPIDAKASLIHHAHVLILKRRVEGIEEILPSVVDRVLHLFIDGTSLSSGEGKIFTVGEVEDYLLKGKKLHERS